MIHTCLCAELPAPHGYRECRSNPACGGCGSYELYDNLDLLCPNCDSAYWRRYPNPLWATEEDTNNE